MSAFNLHNRQKLDPKLITSDDVFASPIRRLGEDGPNEFTLICVSSACKISTLAKFFGALVNTKVRESEY